MDLLSMSTTSYVSVGAALIGIGALAVFARSSRSGDPLPPGPNPIPLLGNLGFPHDYRPWFERWAKEYPDVMTFKVLGMPIIVINSRQGALEVLEKRAQSTAGRPPMVMADELCGFGLDPSRTNDMKLHQMYRRIYASILNGAAARKFWPIQDRQMQRAALEILEDPAKHMAALRRAVADIVFEMAYGLEIEGSDDPMVKRADKALRIVETINIPGNFLVDALPFLKYLPPWLPGAGFLKTAAEWKSHLTSTRTIPFEVAKKRMVSGKARPCLAVSMLEENVEAGQEVYSDLMIKWSCGSVYAGGADTAVAAIHTFLGCMVLHPEVQRKAQEELDQVIGRERPPTLEDRDNLPYCSAIVEEVHRIQPVTAVALPHCMLNDEIYKGYLLPKGAMIVPNAWAMTRDETLFPSPHEFKPERYLSEDGKLLEELPGRQIPLQFGFGRRICAGWQLAHANMFAAFVNILWSSELSVPPGTKVEWLTPIVVNHPHNFELIAKPRFPGAEDVLRNSLLSD